MQKQSSFHKAISKVIDLILLFSAGFALYLFVEMLTLSLNFWGAELMIIQTVEQKMFWISLLVAILAGNLYFIEKLINLFVEIFRKLFVRI